MKFKKYIKKTTNPQLPGLSGLNFYLENTMKINLQGIEKDVVICFARLFHVDINNRIETNR